MFISWCIFNSNFYDFLIFYTLFLSWKTSLISIYHTQILLCTVIKIIQQKVLILPLSFFIFLNLNCYPKFRILHQHSYYSLMLLQIIMKVFTNNWYLSNVEMHFEVKPKDSHLNSLEFSKDNEFTILLICVMECKIYTKHYIIKMTIVPQPSLF